MNLPSAIPFNHLRPAHRAIAGELEEAALRVLRSGWYILGPELEAFEAELAAYHGAAHAVGVASGTDAIELALRALGIGPGDEVITVSHTAFATVCGVARTGATPVLVDVGEDHLTLPLFVGLGEDGVAAVAERVNHAARVGAAVGR